MGIDNYRAQHSILTAPERVKAPAQSDSDDLPETCYCIWVTGDGDVKFDAPTSGEGLTVPVVAKNEWQAFAAKKIWSTGTTATIKYIGF